VPLAATAHMLAGVPTAQPSNAAPRPPSAVASTDHGFAWWAIALIVGVACVYQSFFIHYGLNRLDESWQLYAAMRMHAGGTLYQDVLWVFPPGHVFTAWIATWLAPPGLILSRLIYAGFDVALCAAIYILARRLLMSQPFALLAGLLVALAAPRGHIFQLLFGYRYLVLCVLALIAFDQRLRGRGPAWMWTAGAITGIALVFRLTPAFSVSCGIAVGLLAAHRSWRQWLPDGLRFAAALALAMAPALIWLGTTVGLPRVWQEVVVHPLTMLQPLPLPEIDFPDAWQRTQIAEWFVAVQFRAIWALYGAYVAVLLGLWARALARREPFRHGTLLALTVFGATFFIRSTGRSDEPHLDSVIPPVCLLVAHTASLGFERLWPAATRPRWRTPGAATLCAALLFSWVFLLATDRVVFPRAKGMRALETTADQIVVRPSQKARAIDRTVRLIRKVTRPGDIILNMGPTPLFHVLTGRQGPGYFDTIMPGTFFTEDDEEWFLERLKADPPAAIIWPTRDFDGLKERGLAKVAPRVSRWAWRNYAPLPGQNRWIVMVPRNRPQTPPNR
jgi:hypothetical protein